MTEKRMDIALYSCLLAALIFYLYLNVFKAYPVSVRSVAGDTAAGSTAAEPAVENLMAADSFGAIDTDSLKINASGEEEVFCGGKERVAEASEEKSEQLRERDGFNAADVKISNSGYHLYIDLDALLMYVYKDGVSVKTYEVSGGKATSPSPVGTWKIVSKDTWGEGFGGAWLGFNVPWGMYGIHGTKEPWSVGRTNTSKGCIRMRNKEVLELYEMIPYNTPVTIVYENIPFCSMRDGDIGSDVLQMERALKKLGYYSGGEDGVFGRTLKNSVLKFQKDHGLYRTGIINISTYEKIIELEQEYDKKSDNGDKPG